MSERSGYRIQTLKKISEQSGFRIFEFFKNIGFDSINPSEIQNLLLNFHADWIPERKISPNFGAERIPDPRFKKKSEQSGFRIMSFM